MTSQPLLCGINSAAPTHDLESRRPADATPLPAVTRWTPCDRDRRSRALPRDRLHLPGHRTARRRPLLRPFGVPDHHDPAGRAQASSGAVSLASFYRRRALRLLPAMLAHAHRVCRRRLCRGQRAREPCGRCGGRRLRHEPRDRRWLRRVATRRARAPVVALRRGAVLSRVATRSVGPLPRATRTCRVGVRDRNRPRSAAGARPAGLGRVDPASRVRRRHALGRRF